MTRDTREGGAGCELLVLSCSRLGNSHLDRGRHSARPVAVPLHLAPHELATAQPLAPELLHPAAHQHLVRHGRIGQQLCVAFHERAQGGGSVSVRHDTRKWAGEKHG